MRQKKEKLRKRTGKKENMEHSLYIALKMVY